MANFFSVKVNEIHKQTHDSVSLSLDVGNENLNEFKFVPGQYITIKANINNEDCRRSYSICSSSNEILTVAVKKVYKGKMSTYINENLNEGDLIEIQAPQGNFKLEEINPSNSRKFVGFAAGSGITPILSMVKELSIHEKNSQFLLFFSNKTANDVMFKEELNLLSNNNIKIKYLFSRENGEDELYNGRIDEQKAKELLKSNMEYLNADAFYLCGPEEMIFSIKNVLESFGVNSSKINTNSKKENLNVNFDGESHVTVIYDDEEVEFSLARDGETILDAAMDNDLDVPFSCKGAVCCTCRAKVKEGSVIMDANYALSDQEVDDGYVLTCQSHPNSEKVIIDFD